ncbi:MAG: metallophosphoesterase [Clostridiales bacterium]|nr:metallophosphoesterase [Clostridiales bacterium]MDO4349865.1 metallophosphoesterase [Eubacteriales bacterium]MDY4007635.1 metallophosphoesterase [Candidatus Limiplasma sp.]
MARTHYEYKYRRPQRRRFRFKRLLAALALAALLLYPFAEANMLIVEEHTLYVTNLPANLKNLKVAFASDIHQCAWFSQNRVNELIQTLNSLNADIVVLGGDYATDSDTAVEFFRNAPSLHARLGVFGVVGNHDRTEPESNLSLLVAEMKAYGCLPLVNNVSRVKVGQSYVYIAGVDDFYNGYPDVAGVAAQVSSADFVIFAGHSPDLMPAVLAAKSADGDNHWFDLALFGHTHGGQINLFGHTPFKTLSPEVGARYLSGWLEESRAAVLVSNGVGTSGAPVRLFAPPQVHLITLKAR